MFSNGDVFEKNIDVDVFVDVLQNAKHRANDASNDVNRPPLSIGLSEKVKSCHRLDVSCIMFSISSWRRPSSFHV